MNLTSTLAFILLAASSAYASPNAIDPSRLEEYKNAVQSAISGHNYSCAVLGGTSQQIHDLDLTGVAQATVDTSGAQPALSFESTRTAGQMFQVVFTTSSDFKSVTAFKIMSHTFESVNHGTLLDPNFVQEDKVVITYDCVLAEKPARK